MRVLAIIIVALFAGVAGCSGMCDRYADMSDKCLKNESEGATSVNKCESIMEKCSDSDEKAFEDYITCMEDKAECSGGKSKNDEAALACFETWTKALSEKCFAQ